MESGYQAMEAAAAAAIAENAHRRDAETTAAAAEAQRQAAIHERTVSGEVGILNDLAELQIFGSERHITRSDGTVETESLTFMNPATGEVLASPDKPMRGKLEEILRNPKYGKTQVDRQAYHDEYSGKLHGMLDDGLELSQAKLVMDLGEADRPKVSRLIASKIAEGVDPAAAATQAEATYARKEAQRRKMIKESSLFTSADYDRARKGVDIYNAEEAAEPAETHDRMQEDLWITRFNANNRYLATANLSPDDRRALENQQADIVHNTRLVALPPESRQVAPDLFQNLDNLRRGRTVAIAEHGETSPEANEATRLYNEAYNHISGVAEGVMHAQGFTEEQIQQAREEGHRLEHERNLEDPHAHEMEQAQENLREAREALAGLRAGREARGFNLRRYSRRQVEAAFAHYQEARDDLGQRAARDLEAEGLTVDEITRASNIGNLLEAAELTNLQRDIEVENARNQLGYRLGRFNPYDFWARNSSRLLSMGTVKRGALMAVAGAPIGLAAGMLAAPLAGAAGVAGGVLAAGRVSRALMGSQLSRNAGAATGAERKHATRHTELKTFVNDAGEAIGDDGNVMDGYRLDANEFTGLQGEQTERATRANRWRTYRAAGVAAVAGVITGVAADAALDRFGLMGHGSGGSAQEAASARGGARAGTEVVQPPQLSGDQVHWLNGWRANYDHLTTKAKPEVYGGKSMTDNLNNPAFVNDLEATMDASSKLAQKLEEAARSNSRTGSGDVYDAARRVLEDANDTDKTV